MLGHNRVKVCMGGHLLPTLIKLFTTYDRIGNCAVMAGRGRLACLADHLGHLDYLGCSLNSEFFELRGSGGESQQRAKFDSSICLFRVPGTFQVRNRANAALSLPHKPGQGLPIRDLHGVCVWTRRWDLHCFSGRKISSTIYQRINPRWYVPL